MKASACLWGWVCHESERNYHFSFGLTLHKRDILLTSLSSTGSEESSVKHGNASLEVLCPFVATTVILVFDDVSGTLVSLTLTKKVLFIDLTVP